MPTQTSSSTPKSSEIDPTYALMTGHFPFFCDADVSLWYFFDPYAEANYSLTVECSGMMADLRDRHRTMVRRVAIDETGLTTEAVSFEFRLEYAYSRRAGSVRSKVLEKLVVLFQGETGLETVLELDSRKPLAKIEFAAKQLDFSQTSVHTARFFTYAQRPGDKILRHEFDPLIIIVPKKGGK